MIFDCSKIKGRGHGAGADGQSASEVEDNLSVIFQKPIRILNIEASDTSLRKSLAKEAAQYTYTVNAFPKKDEIKKVCTEFLLRHGTIIPDFGVYQYEAHESVIDLFKKTISARRSSAHKAMERFFKDYKFDKNLFPSEFGEASIKDQYLYLIAYSRFARENYRSNGTLMKTPIITEMINDVFFSPLGQGGHRISLTPELLPSPLITFIYTMIYFRLTQISKHPIFTGSNTSFSAASFWKKLYLGFIFNKIKSAENIDWDAICHYHTNRLHVLQGRAEDTEFDIEVAVSGEAQGCSLGQH